MSERTDITRERYGIQNTGPVYRDSVFLIRDRAVADATLTSIGFITKAAFDAIKPVGNQIQSANIATGVVDMAAGDGLELSFGANNQGATAATGYFVIAYDPTFLTTDAGKQTITGYSKRIIVTGVASFSAASVAMTNGTAALGGAVTNGDFFADSITVTNNGTQSGAASILANVENVSVAATVVSPATIRVGARGARYLQILLGPFSGLTLPTAAFCWGKRIQGGGQGSMRA